MEQLFVRVTCPPSADQRARHRAVVACARALHLSFGDAGALLGAAPLDLPLGLPADEARVLAAVLSANGATAQAVTLAPQGSCPTHPAFLPGGRCERCGTSVCALCQVQGDGLCARCARRARFFRRFASIRAGILLLVLIVSIVWSVREQAFRRARIRWDHTLLVDVVLLRHGSVPAATVRAVRSEMPRLAQALSAEQARYRPGAPPPFSFRVLGPVTIDEAPPEPPEEQRLWQRWTYFLRLRRYLGRVGERGHLDLSAHSIRLYVVADPPNGRVRFVEGFGESGGDLGVVHAAIDEGTVDQALLGLGHELLHCLGASDKYDAEGHAVTPLGLAEPMRVPRYPQRFAEIMVGEVPLSPESGRLVESLDEVRVGPTTAAEIGWAAN